MTPDEFTAALIPYLPLPLAAMLLSLVGGVVLGIALVQGRRVPAVLSGGVALLPLVGIVAAALLADLSPSADQAQAQARLAGMVGPRLLGLLLSVPPALLLALLAAGAGVRHPPRSYGRAVATVLGALAVAAVPVIIGVQEEDLGLAMIRALLAVGLGALVATSLCGDRESGASPEASATAAICWCAVVATGGVASRALPELLLLFTLPDRKDAVRVEYATKAYADVVAPWVPYAWAGSLLVALLAAGIIAWSARQRGGLLAWSALLWPLVALGLVGLGAASPADVAQLASLLGEAGGAP